MIIILSPTKTQDFSRSAPVKSTQPIYLKQANDVMSILKQMPLDDVKSLMSLSDKLGKETYSNIQNFKIKPTMPDTEPAIFSYTGEVFNKLNSSTFSNEELKFCHSHFRILSGVYGILRPLDGIQPYRLEMKSKLKIGQSNSMTQYWKNHITSALNQIEKKTIVNLASNEYVNAIYQNELFANFITIQFKERKNNQFKVIGVFAKQARGRLAQYIVKNKISSVDNLKSYHENGYQYNEAISTEKEWVFTRNES